jgi:hypothetical protein
LDEDVGIIEKMACHHEPVEGSTLIVERHGSTSSP